MLTVHTSFRGAKIQQVWNLDHLIIGINKYLCMCPVWFQHVNLGRNTTQTNPCNQNEQIYMCVWERQRNTRRHLLSGKQHYTRDLYFVFAFPFMALVHTGLSVDMITCHTPAYFVCCIFYGLLAFMHFGFLYICLLNFGGHRWAPRVFRNTGKTVLPWQKCCMSFVQLIDHQAMW